VLDQEVHQAHFDLPELGYGIKHLTGDEVKAAGPGVKLQLMLSQDH